MEGHQILQYRIETAKIKNHKLFILRKVDLEFQIL